MITKDVAASGKITVYCLFWAQVLKNKDAIAIECDGNSWSYQALDEQVRKLASVFASFGVVRGERVAILSENRPEYVVAEMACAMTGAILACQNWRLVGDELKHCIGLVEPKVILTSSRFVRTLTGLGLDDFPVLNLDDTYQDLLIAAPLADPCQDVDPEDGLVILYTSGTTGLPKGALISHRAEIARMAVLRLDCMITEHDASVAWSPLFHMASTDQTFSALMSGACVVVIDGLKADQIVGAAERHSLGWLVMLPGSIAPLIEFLRATKPKLKHIACVGAMADLVPRQEIAELTSLLNAPYLNSFGATETGLPPASAALIPPVKTDYSLSKRPSSLCKIKLVDEARNEVVDGEPGELAISGPTVFSGYWNAPETNAIDFIGGWFHMGDLFLRNPDGTIDFLDRAKYMIKSGGENIYPAEIERVLLTDKRIADAVVIKKPDDKWGEVPVVFIARVDESLTDDDVEALCRENLAGYKRPKEVHFVALNDFPRSITGKIQRHEMEAWL